MNDKIAIYLRLSLADGDLKKGSKDESNSIENQRMLLHDYIGKQEDLFGEIVEYVDDGYTGTNFNRPAFQKMIVDLKQGDIKVIMVKDLSRLGRDYIGVGDYIEQILPLIAQKKGIILLNKADLKVKVSELFLKDKLSWDTIAFSNETKQGLQQLEQYITDKFERGDLQFNDQICLTSIRHKNAVMQAVNALHRVEQSIKDGMPEDFFTIDLMEAYQQLGLINGDTATEDLVNKIFEEFCMGK
mgnify:CR=1 FL=1